MSSNDVNGSSRHDARRRRFELFFYERVGSRYYLRFTNLALALVVCLTVIPCAAILAIYYQQSRAVLDNVNINIRGPGPPANYGTIIPRPTAMPPPRVGRSPGGDDPTRQTPAAPGFNVNAPFTPSPTPSPTPPRPPS